MKSHATYALSVLFILIATTGFSQNTNPKPKQFHNFPEIINCSEQELAKIFNSSPGQDIVLNFSDNFSFQGSVRANKVKYSNLQTAVVVSPGFSNSIFSISKITNLEGRVSYIGRIINKSFFDGYELKKNSSGNYELTKVETDRVIQDCAHM